MSEFNPTPEEIFDAYAVAMGSDCIPPNKKRLIDQMISALWPDRVFKIDPLTELPQVPPAPQNVPLFTLDAGNERLVLIPNEGGEVIKLLPTIRDGQNGKILLTAIVLQRLEPVNWSGLGYRKEYNYRSNLNGFRAQEELAGQLDGFLPYCPLIEHSHYIAMRQKKGTPLDMLVQEDELSLEKWMRTHYVVPLLGSGRYAFDRNELKLPRFGEHTDALKFDRRLNSMILVEGMEYGDFCRVDGEVKAMDIRVLKLDKDDFERIPVLRFAARQIKTRLFADGQPAQLPQDVEKVLADTLCQDIELRKKICRDTPGIRKPLNPESKQNFVPLSSLNQAAGWSK